jgi:hypothetical protein
MSGAVAGLRAPLLDLGRHHRRRAGNPFETACVPLNYCRNPGVNDVSYRGRTIVDVQIGWPFDDVRAIDWNNISETFPLAADDHDVLSIYNITGERDYSWINCAYNNSVFCTPRVPSPYSCIRCINPPRQPGVPTPRFRW